ncbi:MAG TPA: universal stress protein [Chryseosolibacter sp.]
MKRILVPCDFSKQSNEAYKLALDLAAKTKGEIMLMHVIPISNLYTTGLAGEALAFDPVYFGRMEGDIKKEFEKMKKKVADKSIAINSEIVYGDLVVSVKNAIETYKIDLVIMGTSGSSGISEIFIGSNTEKVVRFSPVPVLAVRKAINLEAVRNILLPSTLDLNQTDFIKKLKELQKFFEATIHILHINTPIHFKRDAEATEAMGEFVKYYKLTNYKLHFRNYSREEDGIVDFAYDEKIDLIAMATHARKGLSHLFNTSVTENVVNRLEIPIWTYCLKK